MARLQYGQSLVDAGAAAGGGYSLAIARMNKNTHAAMIRNVIKLLMNVP